MPGDEREEEREQKVKQTTKVTRKNGGSDSPMAGAALMFAILAIVLIVVVVLAQNGNFQKFRKDITALRDTASVWQTTTNRRLLENARIDSLQAAVINSIEVKAGNAFAVADQALEKAAKAQRTAGGALTRAKRSMAEIDDLEDQVDEVAAEIAEHNRLIREMESRSNQPIP